MVKNLLCNAGYMDSIPGQGTKIPHGKGQLSRHNYWSPHATTKTQQWQINQYINMDTHTHTHTHIYIYKENDPSLKMILNNYLSIENIVIFLSKYHLYLYTYS